MKVRLEKVQKTLFRDHFEKNQVNKNSPPSVYNLPRLDLIKKSEKK